jgi:hypothetical protein
LNLDELTTGVVGGGQDGAVDSVYVFVDDALVDEDSEVVLTASPPPSAKAIRLNCGSYKRSGPPVSPRARSTKLENTLRRVLDLGEPLSGLAALYKPTLLARFDLFRRSAGASSRGPVPPLHPPNTPDQQHTATTITTCSPKRSITLANVLTRTSRWGTHATVQPEPIVLLHLVTTLARRAVASLCRRHRTATILPPIPARRQRDYT